MIRIYLSGRLAIEGDRLVDEPRFPGPLGRALFAFLALTRGPVSRSRIAETLWDGEPPDSYDTSLNPLISKMRGLLGEAGADRSVLSAGRGSVELRRVSGLWIDIEHALTSLDAAEGALRRRQPDQAWPKAAVATSIFRRPLLEGVDISWADGQRRLQRDRLIRALEVAAEVWIRKNDGAQAVVAARQLVSADVFRETSHERLIRAHLLAGNRAEALRSYSECEQLLRTELGVGPSPSVQDAYEDALRAGST